MFRHPDPEVLVVGAGPVGLVAALFLQQHGVRVEVVDMHQRTTQHSYALAIHPRTLRILDEAGLSEGLIGAGRKLTKVAYYEGRERRAEIDYSALASKHPYLLVLRQSLLERAAEEALRQKKLKVLWGHRLQSLTADGATLRAEVAKLDQVATGYPVARSEWVVVRSETIRPAYVIGADGYDSAVRRMAGIEMAEHGAGQVFSVYEIEATGELPAEVRVILDPDLTSVYWPLEEGRCRWGFQIQDASEHAASMERLEQLIAARAPWWTARPTQIYWSTLGLFESRLARSFGKGGVWLAGDAAHQAAPVGVHSMNSGLVEARELAARMTRILRAGEAASLLEEFATETHEAWQWLLGAGREVRALPGQTRGSDRPRRGSSPAFRPRATTSNRCSGRSASRPRRERATPVAALDSRDARWYKRATFTNSKRGTGLAQTEAELLDNPVAGRPTLILRSPDFHSITEVVAEPVERRTPIGWWLFFIPSLALLGLLGVAVSWLFWEGIGIWGLNVPVGWAWDITNFVFWVGIGHAGTLISAILFLFRQKWRTSINRSAEAMTIFAVMCALTFPGIHVGRVWVAYWMFPIPNQMGVWPNFRSPLLWDVFAVSIYGTVSVLFWYVGLIPDLATMRDRAKTRTRKFVYGLFALGWRGSVRQWHHYETAYLVLAALATPLVLSVHSIVSMDFAVSLLPGWHTTVFPPYFVAGAIFSGFAMVLTLMVICRKAFRLEHIITLRHFDYMAKIMLVTGTMVGYAYATEFFTAWYSGNPYELFTFLNRALGPYAWAYWTMITCNVISPQIFWFKKARTSIPILFVLSIVINIGMWFERFVIIVTSLHRDFLPSSWGYFTSHDLGRVVPARKLRALLHDVLPVRALSSDGGNRRGQDRPAAGRSALAARPRTRDQGPPGRAAPAGRPSPLPREPPDAAPRQPAPEGALLRNPRRIRDAGGPLSRVRAGA